MAGGPLTRLAQVAQRDGERVAVRGVYTVQHLGGHTLKVPDGEGGWRPVKRIALVRLAGGGFVELGDRPAEELAALDGRTVIATGTLFLPPPREDPTISAPEPLPTLREIRSVMRPLKSSR